MDNFVFLFEQNEKKIERIYIVSEVLYPEIDRDINK